MSLINSFVREWQELAAGVTASAASAGMSKADFLAHYGPYLSEEDAARVRVMPDTTVFWPSSVDEVDSDTTPATFSVTFDNMTPQ